MVEKTNYEIMKVELMNCFEYVMKHGKSFEDSDIEESVKNFLLVSKSGTKLNMVNYIQEFMESWRKLNNHVMESMYKMVIRVDAENRSGGSVGERHYTPAELRIVLHLPHKSTVINWCGNSIQRYEQKCKGGTIKIPSSEIDRIMELNKFRKYRNYWTNHQLSLKNK